MFSKCIINTCIYSTMIISYFQTSDNSEAESLSKRENVYVDLCPSIIPFSKREKGSLLFALIKQKKNELFNLYSSSYLSKLRNTKFIEYFK